MLEILDNPIRPNQNTKDKYYKNSTMSWFLFKMYCISICFEELKWLIHMFNGY